MMRNEIRVIKMTETEYDKAMHQCLKDNYDKESGTYFDRLMSEFEEQFESSIDEPVSYLAVICDINGHRKSNTRTST